MARFAEPDDIKPAAECTHCGAEMYEGDTAYLYENDIFCSSGCLAEAVSEITIIGGY